jgi:hypothetical protein
VGAQTIYRDSLQVNYFGLGNDAAEDNRSGYRLREAQMSGYASMPVGKAVVAGRAGWIPYLKVSQMRGRVPSYPDTSAIFGEADAPGLADQPSFLFADLTARLDTRNDTGLPTRGGRYQAMWAGYGDRDGGRYSSQRFEVEATHYVPLAGPRWTLALHAWLVGTHTGDESMVPFYLLPSVGGKNTIRGYNDYRFHDRAMELVGLESRWRIFSHVDAALFADAGKVAPRISDLGTGELHASYGLGVRLLSRRSTIARLDVAHGSEGWRLIFKTSESFKRSTPSADMRAVVPFVP